MGIMTCLSRIVPVENTFLIDLSVRIVCRPCTIEFIKKREPYIDRTVLTMKGVSILAVDS